MKIRMICTDKSLVDGPGYLTAGESYRVGRSSRCAFVLDDLSVSRFHAEVTVTEETVRVKDLRSRNGTFVDDKRVVEIDVQPGQLVRFGSARFRLVGDGQAVDDSYDISEISTRFVVSPALPNPDGLKKLSLAQWRVLDWLVTGLQEKEVATKLDISQNTVHNHVKRIYKKLGVSSRPELLAMFIKAGPTLENGKK